MSRNREYRYNRNYYDNRGYGSKSNKESDIIDEIISEMKKETPDWKTLLGEGGKVEELVRQNLRNLNPTQIRKFFEQVKKIETSMEEGWDTTVEDALWRLVPTIKYAAGRGNVPKIFEKFVSKSVETIDSENDKKHKKRVFINFERIFEAIVAYHKYIHGR